jgi:hypothetical protein
MSTRNLPAYQCRLPTKFGLAVSLNSAKALGRLCPTKLLALADEVIE